MESVTVGNEVLTLRRLLGDIRRKKLFIGSIRYAGRRSSYAYLTVPFDLVELLGIEKGTRFRVVVGEGYVDYYVDPKGDYAIVWGAKKGATIRFPVNNVPKGNVFIKPIPGGFRVYY